MENKILKNKKINIKTFFNILMIIGIIIIIFTIFIKKTNIITLENKKVLNEHYVGDEKLEMELIAYLHSTNQFIALQVDDVKNKIKNGENFFLYTGRITCEWCRKIVPILANIVTTSNIKLYYLDSETTETNIKLKKFREKYEINTVPSIIYFSSNETYQNLEFDIKSKNLQIELEKEILYLLQ